MPATPGTADQFGSIFVSTADGLRLHARYIGTGAAGTLPVVCLPGLTRTANDFDPLAQALARGKRPRRVIAIDYRGRGLSDYDSNPDHYSPAVELADLVTVLAALGAMPAIFVGTSRGGILTMLLAATQPAVIAAAVLNDIGPVIELDGLLRIKSYVGKMAEPKDFADAAAMLQRLFATQFPRLTDADWLASAKRAFKEQNGRLVPTYDVNLARTLDGVAPDRPLPALWPQFDALAAVPVMVVRGELSDLLSAETVALMKARRGQLDILEVPHQGHAPLLAEPDAIARIAAFIDRADPASHRV
jgi:pimeloyl-ACP methyl ester carboxylesterase